MLRLLITLFSKEKQENQNPLPKNPAISPDDLLEEVRHFLTFEDVWP